jgi:hypothetical protein
VATTRAPPAFAASGEISGSGTARAKTIGSLAIEATIASVTMLPVESPTKTSAPTSISASEPWRPSRLLSLAR